MTKPVRVLVKAEGDRFIGWVLVGEDEIELNDSDSDYQDLAWRVYQWAKVMFDKIYKTFYLIGDVTTTEHKLEKKISVKKNPTQEELMNYLIEKKLHSAPWSETIH